jgi:hypothetical protein
MTVLLYVTIDIGAQADWSEVSLRCLKAASVHSLAVGTYCCLFGLITLLTSRLLIVGVLYAGFFEGILANLPFNIRQSTVIYYTRLIADRSLSFITTLGEGSRATTVDIAARIRQLNVKKGPNTRKSAPA